MINLEDIKSAKYIVIEVEFELLCSGSAFYTYLLQLHKKVSLVCNSEIIDDRFSFLPWYDKKKDNTPSSADLVLNLNINGIELFDFFKEKEIKINKKMATAFYASLVYETNGFKTSLNGTIFAMAKELLELGAEHKICNDFLLDRTTLSCLRLKAILLKNMLLKDDASLAKLSVSDDTLKATGSNLNEAYKIMYEPLKLVYVKEVHLLKSDEDNKILKIIKKEL